MSRSKKIAFILIIVLLVIFLPLSIFGFIGRKANDKMMDNPNHDMYYNGYIWFYDNNNLLSKYECVNKDCELSKTIIDDDGYGLSYFTAGENNETKVILNKYAFITDGEEINLFDISSGSVLTKYKALKNYNVDLTNYTYIVKNMSDRWGVLSFDGSLRAILPFEYDFIGVVGELNNDSKLESFITNKNGQWQIVNLNNAPLSGTYTNVIVYYNKEYIFVNSDNFIKIYDYQNNEYLSNMNINNFYITDRYIIIRINNMLYVYDDLKNQYLKNIPISNYDNLNFNVENNKLTIKNNDIVVETVEL